MNKTSKIILAVAAVMAVAAALVFLMAGSKVKEPEIQKDKATTSSETPAEQAEVAATITYSSDGFSPASVTVGSGQSIKFVNDSDSVAEPSSDPHPTHTSNPELNVGDIQPGESGTITVVTKGTWGMHNHYNPSHKTTVTVE